MWSDKQYATKISPIGAGDGVHELIWPCCSSGGWGEVTGPILCKCDASTDMQTCGGAAPGPRATLVLFSYYYLKCMKKSNRFLMKQINRSAKMEWNKWMIITNFWVRGSPITCAISSDRRQAGRWLSLSPPQWQYRFLCLYQGYTGYVPTLETQSLTIDEKIVQS